MKKVNVLLGSADRRINTNVETHVLDACYNLAAVETTKVHLLGQFVRHGCLASFDLLILAPGCLLAEPNEGQAPVTAARSLPAMRALRAQCTTPILVLSAASGDRKSFADAGADSVLCELYQPEVLKSEVRRLLRLSQPSEQEEPSAWWLASLVLRPFQRIKRA